MQIPGALFVLAWWSALALAASPPRVRLGCEVLAEGGFRELQGKRVGLIANQTSVDAGGVPTWQRLRRAPGVQLVALFAPEHGLAGDVPAGKEFTNATHAPTGLPVYSLYGPGPIRKPTPAMLSGLDVLVYDLQDTGLRAYTYISTLGLAMEACGAAGVEFVVLDRPNPLGGVRVEGPGVAPAFRSFVGQWNIPVVYGLTPGELARMINGEGWITNRCRLTVVPLRGWKRAMTWPDTGLPWVPTSPNVRSFAAALGMPATGLVGELGGLNIGLGGEYPFRCYAAPWLNAQKMASHLNGLRLPGVYFHPLTYRPTRGAFQGRTVHGVRLEFTDPARAPLLALNLYALEAARQLAGRDLLAEAERAGKSFGMFDKVLGSDRPRKALRAGQSAAQVVAGWKAEETAFRQRRQPYLLYP
jgi:uncharacterized protein YbbC (DUF1343 family)